MSRSSSMTPGQFALIAAGLVVAAGFASHPAPARGSADPASMTAPPSGGWTPASWAHAVLERASLPVTRCNLAAVTRWEAAEGGNWENDAAANPLNVTRPEPGSRVINAAGVRSYPSWRAGLTATVATLHDGHYPAVIAALRSGASARAVADAVATSPWGTFPFEVSC